MEFLFPTVDTGDNIHDGQSPGPTARYLKSNIVIAKLSGESMTIVYNASQSLVDVMVKIEEELKTPCKKQCLLYNNIELKVLFLVSKGCIEKKFSVGKHSLNDGARKICENFQ